MNWSWTIFVFVAIIFNQCSCEDQTEGFCTKNIAFNPSDHELIALSRTIVPILNGSVKGEAGKIGVIGGSIEYTGAPYFSAITALKVGADLVYVITTESAAPVIKSYSPDLIVYPFLRHTPEYLSKIKSLLPKMDVIVIGPGLGRERDSLELVYNIIEYSKDLNKPLVIDADGLYAIAKNISSIKDYPCPGIVMTPNIREANKLKEAVSASYNQDWRTYWGECVSILIKGKEDEYYSSNPNYNWSNVEGGSDRRAAGQGDILSGALGTLLCWALKIKHCATLEQRQLQYAVATFAAARFTRMCNSITYQTYGRSMIASDMLKDIHVAFHQLFNE